MARTKKEPTLEDRVNSGYIDLTKTGPLSYKELRELNSGLPQESTINSRTPDNIGVLSTLQRAGKVNYTEQPTGLGKSIYDPGVANQEQIENLDDYRAEAQPWYAQIGAGLAKGVILAGTTFLDGTVGLLFGGAEAIARGDISGLWDNEFSRAMQSVNDWSEEFLPNYYSQNELNSPWYENIFTANFLGDKFIKNLGFSVGALYSGGVTAAGLKLTKLPQLIGAIAKSTKAPAMVSSAVGSVVSAVNEGRIEALNNSRDWQNLKLQELDDAWKEQIKEAYSPQIESLQAEYDAALAEYEVTKGNLKRVGTGDMVSWIDPAAQIYDEKLKALDARRMAIESSMASDWENRASDERYNKVIGKIEEDRLKMGNTDLLLNIPILTASNMVQFTKFYANGFNTARKAGVSAVRDASGAIRYTPKAFSKGKAALKITQGAIAEGTEEISQKAASLISGDYYSTDVNNYYKSQMDENAEQETLDWMKSVASGINETVNDGSSWEEFFIGALTGMLGVPSFRSIRNENGQLRLPIKLEGGALNTYREYQQEIARSEEVANYLNQRVQSPEFLNYYRGMIRHNKYQNDMNSAVEEGDEFNFKNAEHAQFVSDITMFDNAGRLEDLRTFIDSAYDISDENLASIVENTTSTDENGKKIGPFVDSNGNPMYSTEEGKKQMIDKLTKTRDSMIRSIENYRSTKNEIDARTGGNLSNEQLSEMTWLKTQIDDWSQRAKDMIPLVKRTLTNLRDNLENTLSRSLADASMSESPETAAESMETVSHIANQLGIGVDRIKQIQELANMPDKKLEAVLTNPKNAKFVEGVIDDIDQFGSDIISSLDKQRVVQLLGDLPKVGKGIEVYSAKLEEYLADPAKVAANQKKATEELQRKAQQEKNKNVKDALLSSTSLEEFRAALSEEEDPATREAVLKELESEENAIAKNYRETEQYNTEIRRALAQQGDDSQVSQDALTLWEAQYKNAENLEQIANPSSIHIENETAFDEASGGDLNLSESRFQSAKYALHKAMSKVNNDIKFKDRFSPEYKKPVDQPATGKGTASDTTGDSGTATVPHVNTGTGAAAATPAPPVGNITHNMVMDENKDHNRRVETPRSFDSRQQGQRRYYRPVIPELHIEASKEGDFRPFDVVVGEREQGVDFSGIYGYLRDAGAFDYVNAAKLKPGDTLGFMIDPEFNDHTIFLVDTRNNQIVGSIDESDASVARYEGLENLIKKVRDEYQASRQGRPTYNKETGLLSEEYVNSIIRNSPEIPYDTLTWDEKQNKSVASSGKSRIIDVADRKVVVIDINGFHMPFYLSSGHGGKADVTSGKWYPIFGIGSDSWLNKLSGTEINNYYGSPIFKQISEALDRIYGDIREDNSIPKAKATGSHIDFINQDLNPTENGNQNTRELVERNIEEAKSKVIEAASKLSISTPATGKFFATPQTRVSKMMVGRIPFSSEERSLADIPGVMDGDAKPVFGIIKNGVLTTNGKMDDRLIIKPVDMSQKEGRLYLLIPNAAGTYSPAAVRVKHFNTQEFNIDDATVAATPMGKTIGDAIAKLAEATSREDVSLAAKELGQDIHMQDVMITWFDANAGSGIVISKKVRKPDGAYEMVTINGAEHIKEDKYTIYFQSSKKAVEVNGLEYTYEAAKEAGIDMSLFGQPKSFTEIRKEILGTLLRFNLPLQVSASKINDTGYNSRVIRSNVLTSNLTQAKVIGSWFTTDYFDKDGNLRQAVSPASVTPAPGRKTDSPVGGKEGAVPGTTVMVDGATYTVDLTTNTYTDAKGAKHGVTDSNRNIFAMAWAQENFGDSTEGSVMTENKVITPNGSVLDRNTGKYVSGAEAKRIKDKIAGRNRDIEAKRAQSKRVIADIYENQKKVDKSRTDGEFYYILEDDGQYHEYSRVHSRLGGNWIQSEKQKEALDGIQLKLSQLADNPQQFDAYLDYLASNKYKQYAIDFSPYKGKVDVKSRAAIVNIIRDKMAGTNSQRALDAGSAVDTVIRQFFTSTETPVRPSNLTEQAYNALITRLTEVKSRMESLGETFMADNIVLFQKYPDGTRVAGEVDILSIDKYGNFKIYDVKTSKYSFGEFTDRYGHRVNYFANKSNIQRMSSKEYYTLQLSAYKNLFESQYGVPVARLAIMPFVLTYDGNNVSAIASENGIPITYNPAVPVPLATPTRQPETPAQEQKDSLPIFNPLAPISNSENRVLPENAFEEGGEVGYYEKDGKLYNGYIKKIGEVEVSFESGQKANIPIHVAKLRDKGFGRSGEFGQSSEYIVVFPNGYSMTVVKRGTNDQEAFRLIMDALSAKPDKVRNLSFEKTQLYNPSELEEADRRAREAMYNQAKSAPATGSTSGAASTIQKEDAINSHDDEFEDEIELYDDFFDNDDFGKFKKIEGLEVNSGAKYTFSKAKELYDRFLTDEQSKELSELAERVFNIADQLGITIVFNDSLGFGEKGKYSSNNTITFSYQFFANDFLNHTKAPIILHELVHAVTMYVLSDKMKGKLSGNLKEAADAIRETYGLIAEDASLRGEYGVTNAKEMIAEMANPRFRTKLKKLGVWQRIKDAIKKLFGLDSKSSAFTVLDKALDSILDNFSIDLYNDYVGTKKYGSYNPNEWAFYREATSTEKAKVASEVRNWAGSRVYNGNSPNTMIDDLGDGYILTTDGLFSYHYEAGRDVENIRYIYKNSDRNRKRIQEFIDDFYNRAYFESGNRVDGSLWSTLPSEVKQTLEHKGWTEVDFNRISQAERDNAIECAGL